jgi:hypothetical protein
MDVDAEGVRMKPVRAKSDKKRAGSKVHKVSKRKKAKNLRVFPSEVARQKKLAAGKKK